MERMAPSARTLRREWAALCAGASILFAQSGCGLPATPLDPSANPAEAVGLFVNLDLDSAVLAAARGPAGDSFFVFGNRDADGEPTEITAILARTADGRESSLVFENQWPVRANASDGSYATVTYREASAERFTADVDLYDAGRDEFAQYTVDIDIARTVADVAALIEQVTGLNVATAALPDEANAETGADLAEAKTWRRAAGISVNISWTLALVIPLVGILAAGTVIFGQVLVGVFQAAALGVRAIVLLLFSPLLLVNGVLAETGLTFQEFFLIQIFGTIPPPPVGFE